MTSRPLVATACAAVIASLGACASRHADYPPAYQTGVVTEPAADPRAGQYAEVGTVRSIDVVPMSSRTSGGGAILGAVIGGVLGNQVGSFREFDFQRVDDLQVGDRVRWEGGQLYRL
jgi:uncharacterized protein YcfJ